MIEEEGGGRDQCKSCPARVEKRVRYQDLP